jgi:hypothetical protein
VPDLVSHDFLEVLEQKYSSFALTRKTSQHGKIGLFLALDLRPRSER